MPKAREVHQAAVLTAFSVLKGLRLNYPAFHAQINLSGSPKRKRAGYCIAHFLDRQTRTRRIATDCSNARPSPCFSLLFVALNFCSRSDRSRFLYVGGTRKNPQETLSYRLDEEEQEVFQMAGKVLSDKDKSKLAAHYQEQMQAQPAADA